MEIIWIGSESSSGEVNAWQIFLKKINFVYPETQRIMW